MESEHKTSGAGAGALRTWGPVLATFLLLYVPTYREVYSIFWQTSRGSHGAVMLILVGWLFWRERSVFSWPKQPGLDKTGAVLIACGLLLYVAGRSQSFYQLQVGSQIPLLLGLVCVLTGARGLRRLWFPIALLAFAVPVPGSMLDDSLLPLKEWVSDIVDNLLHHAGYPIARNGVVLTIGPYNVLIADACSGLNSMVALSGVGLVYVYAVDHASRWINGALLLSILPIAFLANVIRVVMLVLITYYGGEGRGQEFHDQAGYLEIVLAFGAFFALDHLMTSTGSGWFTRRVALGSASTPS